MAQQNPTIPQRDIHSTETRPGVLAKLSGYISGQAGAEGSVWLVPLWLSLVSGVSAVAATVVIFDRTTLNGISKTWLASVVVLFVAFYAWWARPSLRAGRVRMARYEELSMLAMTIPLVVACGFFIGLVYVSDEAHGYLFHYRLHLEWLVSQAAWPVDLLPGLFLGGVLFWGARDFLLKVSGGLRPEEALLLTLSTLQPAVPIGIVAFGFLLSAASLSMINVNFWRYWATADGLTTLGHYPFTMSDTRQIVEGGVAPYFISFPLLPSMLVASFKFAGHNTLGSYIPIIVGNTLLPLGIYLTICEVTKRPLLALIFSVLTASFPLLRSYTMDVGEADGILMTTVVFAAYFTLRASRPEAGRWTQIAAGLASAIAAFAREEGILYVIPMYLAMLVVRCRDRRFWLSVLALVLFLGCFVAVCVREFGMIWPGNHSATIALDNLGRTFAVASQSGVFSMYAQALGISGELLIVLMVAILIAAALSGIQMLRSDVQLAYMPAVALGNAAMVFFVGPVPAEAAKFQDLFRHASYGLPLLAITIAYGLNEVLESVPSRLTQPATIVTYASLVELVLLELSVLGGPVNPTNTARSPLLTSDVHVTAAEFVVDPLPLPVMRFRNNGVGYLPDDSHYMAIYPDGVYQHYASTDVRRFGNTYDYYVAAAGMFLALLFVAASPVLVSEMSSLLGIGPSGGAYPASGVG